jgi:hypothetical protein
MAKGMEFSLENLKLLDFGKIGVAFSAEVQRVVKDCLDRPGDENARAVSIKFNFKPAAEPGSNDCEQVNVECEITSSVPKRRTKVYQMQPHHNGKLSFNPDLPDEPDQDTLYHGEERKEDER